MSVTPVDQTAAWNSFGDLCRGFYATGPAARWSEGAGWFAALSGMPSSELNVCGVGPEGTDADALLAALGPHQPTIVFTCEQAVALRSTMAAAGFEITEIAEPLMRCAQRPLPVDSAFAVGPALDGTDLEVALHLTSQAHCVDVAQLDATIGSAARAGSATVWLARLDGVPVSTVWLARSGTTLGVMEMMTPPQHQGQGAGRALLSAALDALWSDDVDQAVLLSTPAGRRLYESLGFVAVDESLTCYRGLEDDVLDAIGQAH